jgi:dipeptidyl aminopeptidase/acylaminoacyl peptidase
MAWKTWKEAVSFGCLALFAALVIVSTLPASARPSQAFQVQDGIELERLYEPWGDSATTRSRDGRYLAFVTKKADLSSDANIYRLWVYATAGLRTTSSATQRPPPHLVIEYKTMASTERPAISDFRWSDDGSHLFYLAQTGKDLPQLMTLDLVTRKARQVTREVAGVWSYAVSTSSSVLYWAGDVDGGADQSARPPYPGGLVAPRARFHEVMTGETVSSDIKRYQLVRFDPHRRQREVLLRPAARAHWSRLGVWMSPNGRFALALEPTISIPRNWLAFTSSPFVREHKARSGEGESDSGDTDLDGRLEKLVLFDLGPTAIARLAEYPTGRFIDNPTPVRAAFSHDSKRALVSSLLAPIDIPGEKPPTSGAHIATIDIDTAKVTLVAALPTGFEADGPGLVTHVAWSDDERLIRVFAWSASRRAYSQFAYERNGTVWQRIEASEPVGSVQIVSVESIDQPPHIDFRIEGGGHSWLLLDLNSRLRTDIRAGVAAPISWSDTRMRSWSGGIVYPPDYDPKRRYPLVVQTRGFDSDKFLANGPYPNAFAARALAAHDMLVVQMQDAPDAIATPDEAAIHLAGLEGLIDQFSSRGMVDTAKLGLVGFSRSGYHLRYALANSKYRFAAATLADGSNLSFSFYVSNFNVPGLAQVEDRILGGPPIAANLETWTTKSTSFSYDRIDTPLLIEVSGGPAALPGHWEMLALMRLLNRPAEMLYLPDAGHVLVRPRQQYLSQQANVDWLSFWLNGDEDAAPQKAEQYKRWHKMLRTQCKRLKSADAPWYCRP